MAAVPSVGRPSFAGGPARAPQAAATEGLYERHAAKILSYCAHQLGSREEAEDAVQTTFMNAFRALGRGVVPEAESAWLFKIAENVCLSRRRSSWRRGRIESPSDFEVIEEVVPGPSRQRDELIGIEDALASMPEQQRRAILLREWQGLSYREISDELELSQSAVETLIFRARRSLAQGLEQPDLVKPKRKSFRRALHMIDLGTIAAAAKALLAGSVAVKTTAAAVAVTAAVTAASVTPKLEGHSPKSASAPALVASKAAASPASAAVAAGPAPSAYAPAEHAVAGSTATSRAASSEQSAVKDRAASAPAAGPRSAPVALAPAAPTENPTAAPAPPIEQAAPPAPAEPAQPPVTEQPAPTEPPAATQPKREEPKGESRTDKAERKGHTGRRGGNGKGREDQATPPVEAPAAPVAVVPAAEPTPVLPAAVEEQNGAKGAKERERGRGKNRRDLAAAPAPEPVAVVAPAAPAEATDAAPAIEPVPAPAAEPGAADPGRDKDKGHRRRK